MPLVTDYNGVYINTSVKAVEDGKVALYAPVFKGIDYRFATHVANYEEEFKNRINMQQKNKRTRRLTPRIRFFNLRR